MMKKIVIVALTSIFSLSAIQPSKADIVIPQNAYIYNMATETTLAQVLTELKAQAATSVPAEVSSEKHLIDELINWGKQLETSRLDHIQIPKEITNVMNNLSTKIRQNNDILVGTQAKDEAVTNMFEQIVPKFRPDQSYLTYASQLKVNNAKVFAEALGVAKQNLNDENAIADAIDKLEAAEPTNELQALQTLVKIGKAQLHSLASLIKGQSAMIKSMAVAYHSQSQLAGGGGGEGAAPPKVNKTSAYLHCSSKVPFLFGIVGDKKQEILDACLKDLEDAQKINSQSLQTPIK